MLEPWKGKFFKQTFSTSFIRCSTLWDVKVVVSRHAARITVIKWSLQTYVHQVAPRSQWAHPTWGIPRGGAGCCLARLQGPTPVRHLWVLGLPLGLGPLQGLELTHRRAQAEAGWAWGRTLGADLHTMLGQTVGARLVQNHCTEPRATLHAAMCKKPIAQCTLYLLDS